jgi:hypothetical protein
LSKLIIDIRPDVVIHIGDSADMPSLSGYDKGRKSFQGRTYRADINSHLDFQEKVWGRIRSLKKRLPRRVFLEGNHENRIKRALDIQPELEGTISFNDLDLGRWYTDVVEYQGNTPGIIEIDGVHYAHYFISGVAGRPLGGEHPGHALIDKRHASSTCGHLHQADWYVTSPTGRPVMGCFVGCYQDYNSGWAGEANKLWWRGIVVKRNVDKGAYDPQFISLDAIRNEYNG